MPASLKLYTANTPNGQKPQVLLEELKARYPGAIDVEYIQVSLGKNEQKEQWFLDICPNGRIPALKDGDHNVFESAAILLWLVQKYDKEAEFYWDNKTDPEGKLRSEALQWIFWVQGGLGPMAGQANHFTRYAPEDIPYGQKRYQDETARLLSVLDKRLEGRDWLVGEGKGKYSIADMTAYPWAWIHKWSGVSDDRVGPNVKAWLNRNWSRPTVKAGLRIPEASSLIESMQDPDWEKNYAEEAKKKAEDAKKWIHSKQ